MPCPSDITHILPQICIKQSHRRSSTPGQFCRITETTTSSGVVDKVRGNCVSVGAASGEVASGDVDSDADESVFSAP